MDWPLVFDQSKVNGGLYCGELLTAQAWEFPKGTWFQKRLEQVRAEQGKPGEND